MLQNLWNSFFDTMIADGRYMLILRGLSKTLTIAFFAIIIGTAIGIVVALMRVSKNKVLGGIAGVYINLIRGIPLATQLLIFYLCILGPAGVDTIYIAIIGFGINSGAYVAEIIRAGIQGIDIGQMEAGRSLGLTSAQTMRKIILPQAIKAILPTYTNEFVVLIKETSIASFIAVTDLTKAADMIRNTTFNAWWPLITAAAIYLCLTSGLTVLFRKLERRLARSDRS